MDQGRTQPVRGTVEIDLMDLMRRVGRHWRRMLLGAFVGAIIMDMVHAVIYIRNWGRPREREAKVLQEVAALMDPEDLEDDIQAAEDAFNVYKVYMAHKEELEIYQSRAIFLELDPMAVPHERVQYYISGSKDVSNIITSFSSGYVLDQDVCAEIAAALGRGKEEAQYVRELVGFSNESGPTTTLMPLENNTADDDLSGIFSFTITAPDRESCDVIAGIIKGRVQARLASLKGIYGDFKMEEIGSIYWVTSDTELLERQRGIADSLNSVATRITALKKSMEGDSDQELYFNALLDNYRLEKARAASEEFTGPFSVRRLLFSGKYVAIGLFLGILAVCCWHGLKYVLDPGLKTAGEMESHFGIPVLAAYGADSYGNPVKKKGLDALIGMIGRRRPDGLDAAARTGLLLADLKEQAVKMKIRKVHVISLGPAADKKHGQKTDSGLKAAFNEAGALVEKIKRGLSDAGLEVGSGISTSLSPESLKELSHSDAAFFVAVTGGSDTRQADRDSTNCRRFRTKILGAAVFET